MTFSHYSAISRESKPGGAVDGAVPSQNYVGESRLPPPSDPYSMTRSSRNRRQHVSGGGEAPPTSRAGMSVIAFAEHPDRLLCDPSNFLWLYAVFEYKYGYSEDVCREQMRKLLQKIDHIAAYHYEASVKQFQKLPVGVQHFQLLRSMPVGMATSSLLPMAPEQWASRVVADAGSTAILHSDRSPFGPATHRPRLCGASGATPGMGGTSVASTTASTPYEVPSYAVPYPPPSQAFTLKSHLTATASRLRSISSPSYGTGSASHSVDLPTGSPISNVSTNIRVNFSGSTVPSATKTELERCSGATSTAASSISTSTSGGTKSSAARPKVTALVPSRPGSPMEKPNGGKRVEATPAMGDGVRRVVPPLQPLPPTGMERPGTASREASPLHRLRGKRKNASGEKDETGAEKNGGGESGAIAPKAAALYRHAAAVSTTASPKHASASSMSTPSCSPSATPKKGRGGEDERHMSLQRSRKMPERSSSFLAPGRENDRAGVKSTPESKEEMEERIRRGQAQPLRVTEETAVARLASQWPSMVGLSELEEQLVLLREQQRASTPSPAAWESSSSLPRRSASESYAGYSFADPERRNRSGGSREWQGGRKGSGTGVGGRKASGEVLSSSSPAERHSSTSAMGQSRSGQRYAHTNGGGGPDEKRRRTTVSPAPEGSTERSERKEVGWGSGQTGHHIQVPCSAGHSGGESGGTSAASPSSSSTSLLARPKINVVMDIVASRKTLTADPKSSGPYKLAQWVYTHAYGMTRSTSPMEACLAHDRAGQRESESVSRPQTWHRSVGRRGSARRFSGVGWRRRSEVEEERASSITPPPPPPPSAPIFSDVLLPTALPSYSLTPICCQLFVGISDSAIKMVGRDILYPFKVIPSSNPLAHVSQRFSLLYTPSQLLLHSLGASSTLPSPHPAMLALLGTAPPPLPPSGSFSAPVPLGSAHRSRFASTVGTTSSPTASTVPSASAQTEMYGPGGGTSGGAGGGRGSVAIANVEGTGGGSACSGARSALRRSQAGGTLSSVWHTMDTNAGVSSTLGTTTRTHPPPATTTTSPLLHPTPQTEGTSTSAAAGSASTFLLQPNGVLPICIRQSPTCLESIDQKRFIVCHPPRST